LIGFYEVQYLIFLEKYKKILVNKIIFIIFDDLEPFIGQPMAVETWWF